MTFSEIKKIVFTLVFLFATLFLIPKFSSATDYNSPSFTVKDPVIDSGLKNSGSASFGLGQSLSQVAIGKSTSSSFQLWSGFQYFFKVKPNVLTAIPGDAEVNLSWTVPQTYLGVNVGGYEVGTGTVSGSYTFQSVGNATSFTKTGLTNGTPYYFIIKTLSTGGSFLVFSNQATATPNGATPPPPPPPAPSPGGGSSGPAAAGNMVITGTTFPGATVTLLRDSVIVRTTTADMNGKFSFTLDNLPAGTYSWGVYATDPNGIQSATVGFESQISNSITSTKNNLILPPTIQQSFVAVKQGEAITFSGYSAANVPVTLTFSGAQNLIRAVTSNASGFYSFSLQTGGLQKGNYFVFAKTNVNGQSSQNSFVLSFNIGDKTETPSPTGQCKRSDLNCDGRVELVDFSILLYFWEQTEFSKNPRVDIDKSGQVGLRDLSIMLYDWTG